MNNEVRKGYIKFKLSSDERWIKKGLLLLFDHQTNEEQRCETTNKTNGVGFTSSDAKLLSSFSKQLHRGKTLSLNQIRFAKKKLPKYWRQILVNSDISKLDKLIQNDNIRP